MPDLDIDIGHETGRRREDAGNDGQVVRLSQQELRDECDGCLPHALWFGHVSCTFAVLQRRWIDVLLPYLAFHEAFEDDFRDAEEEGENGESDESFFQERFHGCDVLVKNEDGIRTENGSGSVGIEKNEMDGRMQLIIRNLVGTATVLCESA